MANNKNDINVFDLKLGESFSEPANGTFYTLKYDHRPKSLDSGNRTSILTVQDKKIKITFPNTNEEHKVNNSVDYSGNVRDFQRECVLKINTKTGEAVLEKIHNQIIVKRQAKESVKQPIPDFYIDHAIENKQKRKAASERAPKKKYITKKMKMMQAETLKDSEQVITTFQATLAVTETEEIANIPKKGRKTKSKSEAYKLQKMSEPVKPKRKYTKKADKSSKPLIVMKDYEPSKKESTESHIRNSEISDSTSEAEFTDDIPSSYTALQAVGNLNLNKELDQNKPGTSNDKDVNKKPFDDLEAYLSKFQVDLSQSDSD